MSKFNVDLKVMVVEDSKVTMKALCNYLKRMGMSNQLLALNGQQAIDIFSSQRPDIVLLDPTLPDIDGLDVAKKIRSLETGDEWTAIVFLTSMDKDEDVARAIDAGADDYLLKPSSEIVLRAKITTMCRMVKMQRALVQRIIESSNTNSSVKENDHS